MSSPLGVESKRKQKNKMENSYTPLVANSTAGSVDNDNDVADGAIAEKPLSRKMSCDSIEKLDTIDDFSSFKCYSSKEIANRVVMFNQIGLAYSLDRPVTAYFYASKETYEMLPDDTVGICPLQKKAIIKKQLSDCEEFGFDQDDGLASKKVVFDLRGVEDLPVDSRHYYQFVYENALGDILGISMPFQFNQELNDMPQQRSPSPSTSENTNGELNNKVTDEDFVMVSLIVCTIVNLFSNVCFCYIKGSPAGRLPQGSLRASVEGEQVARLYYSQHGIGAERQEQGDCFVACRR